MADDGTPSLHVDTDWKKQAQDEKRRLAEQEKQKAAAAVSTAAPATPAALSASGVPAAGDAAGAGRARELPQASFTTLVQSIVTQALYYLGDLAPRGTEPQVSLELAKHQIDTLGVLEDKSQKNLNSDEQRSLDAALYEVRSRYVAVASQYIL